MQASCTPELWNSRESRLNGKSKEAVETNAKIDKLLLAVNTAFDNLVERKIDFDAANVKNLFQGSMETQMTLMKMTDAVCDDIKAHIGLESDGPEHTDASGTSETGTAVTEKTAEEATSKTQQGMF